MSSYENGAWSNLCSAQNLLSLFWSTREERSYCCHLGQNQSNLCATPERTAPWGACGVCLQWNTLHRPPQKQQSHTSCCECLQQRGSSSFPGSKQRGNSILSLWKGVEGKTINWGPKVPHHGHILLGCSPSHLNAENPYAVVPGVTTTSGFAHFMLPLV